MSKLWASGAASLSASARAAYMLVRGSVASAPKRRRRGRRLVCMCCVSLTRWRGVWAGALSAALSGFFDYSGRWGLRLPRLFATAVCTVGGPWGLGLLAASLRICPGVSWRVAAGGFICLGAWGYWPSFWSISSIGRAGVAMVISLTSLGMYLKAEYAVCRS